MTSEPSDAGFVGSVPHVYAALLVPMIFAEPARSLAAAIEALRPGDVLETAAGTGVLTGELVALPGVAVVATDLSPAMLEVAQANVSSDRVRWQVADAMQLPFDDAAFDVVACQFGAMFFPDKVGGYREAARVLRPGGSFVFTMWDRIESNVVADVVVTALSAAAPADSFDFVRRTPHGHFDTVRIGRDLDAAGFREVGFEVVDGTSRTTAQDGAVAYCQGTPIRGDIDRSSLSVEFATAIAAEALEERFGTGTFDAPTRWIEVTARQ